MKSQTLRPPRAGSLAIVAMTLFMVSPQTIARTWYVGGSGADFSQIQPAIDAASDGDLIIVRPGMYDPFTLAKGVMMRASDSLFSVDPNVGPVHVRDLANMAQAGISGMSMDIIGIGGAPECLVVSNCEGEVILENTQLVDHSYFSSGAQLKITDCDNVSVTELTAVNQAILWDEQGARGVVQIERSFARMSQIVAQGGKGSCCGGYGYDGLPGQSAIAAFDSSLVLAHAHLTGGGGGDGSGWYRTGGSGGEGGHALEASNSRIDIVGFPGYGLILQGARGGTAWWDYSCYCYLGRGGDGGDGFHGDSADVSLVSLAGGAGGDGDPPGGSGQPADGTTRQFDTFPMMTLSGDLRPGATFEIDIDTPIAGTVILLVANHGGSLYLPGNEGPPVGVLPFPGGRFIAVGIGHLNGGAHLGLSLGLPSDPMIAGIPLQSQIALIADAGSVWLSNAAARIIGE
ncbi:MAG: hypothetical protein AB1486_16640 [Planctomycetota bacterium]